jgi:transcription termination factor NusB
MSKKRYLQTNFLKFILEKFEKEEDEKEIISKEETNETDDEVIDQIDQIPDEEEPLDDIIKEYLKLEKKYKMNNDKISNRRK